MFAVGAAGPKSPSADSGVARGGSFGSTIDIRAAELGSRLLIF